MKNYKEKEKKLENVLKKLNTMSNRVIKMSNDINSLNLEKNQLLREKVESENNFQKLSKQHQGLKSELEKVDKDINYKFDDKNNFNQKIDELNQETETLIDEIEKWQT
jgi:chromosome segregation ATPase